MHTDKHYIPSHPAAHFINFYSITLESSAIFADATTDNRSICRLSLPLELLLKLKVQTGW